MLEGSASPTHEDDHHVFKQKQRKIKNRVNRNHNSRRFSDEQIKSLESLFKMENKLQPRKKLEMARELGLHPRQVAIWFQNRRARWKSKQVEQDYTTLKAEYDTLTHRFQSLKKEKHALLKQLRNLRRQLKEPVDIEGIGKDLEESSGSENEDGNNGNWSGGLELEQEDEDEDDPGKRSSDRDLDQKEEETNMKVGDDHKVSEEVVVVHDHEDQTVSNFDLGSLFDQSCSNWWEYWSSN